MKKPLILLTNDDGIYAPGIKHLWKALQEVADVVVVAPSTEQSAVSLSITIRHPLKIEEVEWPFAEAKVWCVNGTPADCVKLALNVILPERPTFIFSGINRGNNAGRNVHYSGTVAAVVEGILHDIPGIALSVSDYFNPNYAQVERFIPCLVEYLLAHPLPPYTFLNVNFPKNMEERFLGYRMAQQGKEFWLENPEKREHPAEGHAYYWLGTQLAQFEEHPQADVVLLREGYATVVPVFMGNLTHQTYFAQQKELFENFVS